MEPHLLIEQNFHRHSYLIPTLTPGMRAVKSANLSYADSGLSCDTFNIIYIINGHSIQKDELERAMSNFISKDYIFCIWVAESQLTDHLKQIFEETNIKLAGSDPGMILNLEEYNSTDTTGFENIKIALNKADVGDFAKVIASNWQPADQNVVEFYDRTSTQLLNSAFQIMLANYYIEDKVVGCIELFPTDNEVAGIYNLSTLETHRSKGIGSALMRFALNKSKEAGYKKVVLQASQDGINIYRKLGFQEATMFYEYKP